VARYGGLTEPCFSTSIHDPSASRSGHKLKWRKLGLKFTVRPSSWVSERNILFFYVFGIPHSVAHRYFNIVFFVIDLRQNAELYTTNLKLGTGNKQTSRRIEINKIQKELEDPRLWTSAQQLRMRESHLFCASVQ